MTEKKILGLIVNPVAGIGGRVGLKGSDGREIQSRAISLGAIPSSQGRAREALEPLMKLQNKIEVIAYPAEMGGDVARDAQFSPIVIGDIESGNTTPADTECAALEMKGMGADLILFAGGDGTARDIFNAIDMDVPVLGIPAGVKIHSAVFATNPRNAGELALMFLEGSLNRFREAEVMDIDEDLVRRGVISAKLYGYLRVPFHQERVQNLKSPNPSGERKSLEGIALVITDQMNDGALYILGPGTTTKMITDKLGLPKTLIGVDVVQNGEILALDVNESQLLEITRSRRAKIVLSIIGGQGYILGRGNQQLSPEVLRRVGRENIIVIGSPEKLLSLSGRPLLVDTGSDDVNEMLKGYVRIITGYKEEMIYKVST